MTALVLGVLAYGAVLAALFAFGVHGYVLLWRRRAWRPGPAKEPSRWPSVAVQLPVYDERDVIARAVEAAGRLRYPGPLEIQVLDDSDDDTTALAASALARVARTGVAGALVRREGREGFKAGALAHGLRQTDAELLLVLDADFVPPEDLLLQLVPLLAEADVACVQARWGHLDPPPSALTRAQTLGIDVHFSIEQRARAAAEWPVAFNGSGGLWRRSALEDAGGWSADTLTEDLDLSYRAWLRGWRIVYAHDVVCPGEVPESMSAFKAQQRRWARGSTTTARKLLGAIWRARRPLSAKLAATLHLTHYSVHPLMLASAALALPLGLLAASGSRWWSVLPPLAMASGGPLAMALAVLAEQRATRARVLRDVTSMMVLGTGLALSNSLAVLAGALVRGGTFARTPKGGRASSYTVGADRLALGELACSAGCALLAVWLASRGVYAMTPFLLLYAAGLGSVGVASLRETWQRRGEERVVQPEA